MPNESKLNVNVDNSGEVTATVKQDGFSFTGRLMERGKTPDKDSRNFTPHCILFGHGESIKVKGTDFPLNQILDIVTVAVKIRVFNGTMYFEAIQPESQF